MSKLQELIRELCPDGVEYKMLGEIVTIKNGKDYKHLGKGNIPVYGSGGIMTYVDAYAYNKPTVLIPRKGSLGNLFYVDTPFWNVDTIFYTEVDTQQIDVKYLYYLLAKEHLENLNKAGGVPSLTQSILNKIMLPIPPLEVQEEIVRILDHFTNLAAELQAKLEAELQARKEQYEYYRNKLLIFDKTGGGTQSVTWMKMSEICLNITSGGTPNTSQKEYYMGNIPWLRTQEVDWHDILDTDMKISEEGLKKSSAKMIPINCVIVAMYGATAAKVAINKIPLCTNQACCNLEINPQKAYYRFVYQWLCKEYGNLRAKGEGSQHNINSKKIKNYLIPIPSLAKQERIAAILDRFERLTTDLQTGLPAEIAAVQEQYEYYRNKLLSFPRTKISA